MTPDIPSTPGYYWARRYRTGWAGPVRLTADAQVLVPGRRARLSPFEFAWSRIPLSV